MKLLEKVWLLLIGTVFIFGLSFSHLEAATVTVGGGMDVTYFDVVGGGKTKAGKSSIWEYALEDANFHLTHIHPKLSMDISDRVSGELMFCFSDVHEATTWIASMDYIPIVNEGFGDNPITLRFGRFMIPFGYYNEAGINPVDLKTISRPLMYVDHSQEDMELHSGPRPIFMSPFFDTGVLAFGSKWLREEKDQLWYGLYVVNGMYYAESKYTGLSRIDINWEGEHVPHGDPSKNKQIGTRLAYSVGDLFTVGGSYLTGKYDAKSELKNTIYGGDLHVALGKANIRFEYTQNPVDWINKSGAEVNPEDLYTMGTRKEHTKKGWYAQVDFPFDLFSEAELAKKFELAALYSTLSDDRTKPNETFEDMSRISLALSFSPEAALKFKLEYQLTMLGSYNATASNVTKYGTGHDDVSRIMFSTGLAF